MRLELPNSIQPPAVEITLERGGCGEVWVKSTFPDGTSAIVLTLRNHNGQLTYRTASCVGWATHSPLIALENDRIKQVQ